jgi:hypothetical protein
MPRNQMNFDSDQDVRQWLDTITPGFRVKAINQACREAKAAGKAWLMGLYSGEKGYKKPSELGNGREE